VRAQPEGARLQASSELIGIAEIGIGMAGFAGVAAAILLRRSYQRDDQLRFLALFFATISVVVLAYIPRLFSLGGMADEAVWNWSSAAFLVVSALALPLGVTIAREARTFEKVPPRWAFLPLWVLFVGAPVLQLLNLLGLAGLRGIHLTGPAASWHHGIALELLPAVHPGRLADQALARPQAVCRSCRRGRVGNPPSLDRPPATARGERLTWVSPVRWIPQGRTIRSRALLDGPNLVAPGGSHLVRHHRTAPAEQSNHPRGSHLTRIRPPESRARTSPARRRAAR